LLIAPKQPEKDSDMTSHNMTSNMTSKCTLRTLAIAACVGVGALAVSTSASANGVYWSIGVSSPGVQVGVSNAQTYYPVYETPQVVYQQPQVVYQQPQVVYQQPQVIYQQPQVVYQQPQVVYVQPRPVYVQPRPVFVQPAPVYHRVPQPIYTPPHHGSHHPGWYRAPGVSAPVVHPLSHPYGRPVVEVRSGDRGRNHQ
jgi:hypothetical protein